MQVRRRYYRNPSCISKTQVRKNTIGNTAAEPEILLLVLGLMRTDKQNVFTTTCENTASLKPFWFSSDLVPSTRSPFLFSVVLPPFSPICAAEPSPVSPVSPSLLSVSLVSPSTPSDCPSPCIPPSFYAFSRTIPSSLWTQPSPSPAQPSRPDSVPVYHTPFASQSSMDLRCVRSPPGCHH